MEVAKGGGITVSARSVAESALDEPSTGPCRAVSRRSIPASSMSRGRWAVHNRRQCPGAGPHVRGIASAGGTGCVASDRPGHRRPSPGPDGLTQHLIASGDRATGRAIGGMGQQERSASSTAGVLANPIGAEPAASSPRGTPDFRVEQLVPLALEFVTGHDVDFSDPIHGWRWRPPDLGEEAVFDSAMDAATAEVLGQLGAGAMEPGLDGADRPRDGRRRSRHTTDSARGRG